VYVHITLHIHEVRSSNTNFHRILEHVGSAEAKLLLNLSWPRLRTLGDTMKRDDLAPLVNRLGEMGGGKLSRQQLHRQC
jgi:hypothetical protein